MSITIGLGTGDDDATLDAAHVWAAAVAERDGTEPDVARALGGIRGRLRMRGANLLLAQDDADVVGFAVTVPQDGGLELLHLATRPDAAGHGVARTLLDAVDALARAGRHPHLQLWVIEGHERAVDLYERTGWVAQEQTQARDDGRVERRFRKPLP